MHLHDFAVLMVGAVNPGGHTNTERGYLPILASKLRKELRHYQETEIFTALTDSDQEVVRQLEIDVSAEDRHPLKIV